ncbi:hypothetical protein PV703_29180 [Streptomyces sp. ME01-24h]|nr:hypothetical protein [Streptomyces sp. ME01-24h]
MTASYAHRVPAVPTPAWTNHLRVPAFLSGVLLLTWFPLVFRLSRPFEGAAGLTIDVYLGRWLAVTGVLFGLSAVVFAVRLGRSSADGRRTGNGPPRAAVEDEPRRAKAYEPLT